MIPPITKHRCEYLRNIAKQRFDRCLPTWIDLGRWAAPHRIKWMLSQMEGERNNAHIVDATHILALRSYVAGFLEGNTSASRPWYRFGTSNPDLDNQPDVHEWLDRFTMRTLHVLSTSNFYNSAGQFYYDYGVFNTGAHYIEELKDRLYFHTMMPGSYFVLNNGYNEAITLVREFSLTVKAIVDTYGKKDKHGNCLWDNISGQVKKMYEDGNYTTVMSIVHVVDQNSSFDPSKPILGSNKPWVSVTYELGGPGGQYYQYAQEFGEVSPDPQESQVYLNVSYSKRKPFIIGKSDSGNNFEYGEKGPTLDALGLIKSANKKAIAKDQALELMLRPPLQGPASLKKAYITSASNSYVPLDPTSVAQKGGLRSIFEINPAIQFLISDVSDIRSQIGKLYYEDYLLYLTQNPKTRTAAETHAVVQEQQLVIGPNLQSLNTTYNIPVVEFVADYVMFEDPVMKQWPIPPALQGQFLRPEFISVFAQAQRAADLPGIQQYMAMIEQVGQLNPKIWDKVNIDKLADLYEDRLFLPAGLNNPQGKVDAMREQAQIAQQRQQMLEQTLPAVAKSAKDIGIQHNGNKNGGGPQ